jgi:copper(I)-binding protein
MFSMIRASAAALAALAVVLLGAAVQAHTTQKGSLQVVHPWVEPAEAGAATVAHPTLANLGGRPITVTNVRTPVAADATLRLDGEVVPVVTLPPGETLTPERLTLRLSGLRADLPRGKGVKVTFHLVRGEPVEIVFAIGAETMNPQDLVTH